MALERKKELAKELARLQKELREREASLPAHSLRPQQLQRIFEWEEKIQELQKKIGLMGS